MGTCPGSQKSIIFLGSKQKQLRALEFVGTGSGWDPCEGVEADPCHGGPQDL